MPSVKFIYDFEETVDLGNGVALSKKPDIHFTMDIDQKPTIEQIDMLYANWLEYTERHAGLKHK